MPATTNVTTTTPSYRLPTAYSRHLVQFSVYLVGCPHHDIPSPGGSVRADVCAPRDANAVHYAGTRAECANIAACALQHSYDASRIFPSRRTCLLSTSDLAVRDGIGPVPLCVPPHACRLIYCPFRTPYRYRKLRFMWREDHLPVRATNGRTPRPHI